MKVFGESGVFPVELDKNAKTLIWSCAVPLLLAVNCIFLRAYLELISRGECPNEGGFSFDLYGTFPPSIAQSLFLDDLQCADAFNQFVYKLSGVLIIICIGLSIVLPGILYLRRRSVIQTKLFG